MRIIIIQFGKSTKKQSRRKGLKESSKIASIVGVKPHFWTHRHILTKWGDGRRSQLCWILRAAWHPRQLGGSTFFVSTEFKELAQLALVDFGSLSYIHRDSFWSVAWNMFYFSIYCIRNNHPNWLAYFSEGWNHQPDDSFFFILESVGMDCLMRRFFAARKLRRLEDWGMIPVTGNSPHNNDGLEAPRPGITPGRVCMMSLVLLFSK